MNTERCVEDLSVGESLSWNVVGAVNEVVEVAGRRFSHATAPLPKPIKISGTIGLRKTHLLTVTRLS